MNRHTGAIVSVIMTVLFMCIVATPVNAAVAYSEDCYIEMEYDIMGIESTQYYGDEEWDPESNNSQVLPFWNNGDDLNISLELYFLNNHIGWQKTLDFYYWVDVDGQGPPPPPWEYKIIEGASYEDSDSYENTVEVDYQDDTTRELYIEIYNVGYYDYVGLVVDVYVFDGPGPPLAHDFFYYEWVAPY